jgi:predicted MPP superfamily phosphohydrolase
MNRRTFLKRAAVGAAAASLAAAGYGLAEASAVRVTRYTVAVPRLPSSFAGLTVALAADLHHGPLNGLTFIRSVVSELNELNADLIALSGDFIENADTAYVRPCFEALSALRAPLGVFAALGNHDHWPGPRWVHAAIREFGLTDLTNAGRWLERGGGRLRLGGVDDLWNGKQDLAAALGDTAPDETCVLLSHNPDYAETLTDRRVGLVLSGHLHGGQINVPWVAPQVPSRYGKKYLYGLVRAPHTQAFVTRGVGVVSLPFRVRARPEVNLLTLTPPGQPAAAAGPCAARRVG